jgi:hypothetical protein
VSTPTVQGIELTALTRHDFVVELTVAKHTQVPSALQTTVPQGDPIAAAAGTVAESTIGVAIIAAAPKRPALPKT